MEGIIKKKPVRILLCITLFLIQFIFVLVYYRLKRAGGTLYSMSYYLKYPKEMTIQCIVANLPIILFYVIFKLMLRDKMSKVMHFRIYNRKISVYPVIIFGIVYLLSLFFMLRQSIYTKLVVFQWVYYLLLVALPEEFLFRSLMPAILGEDCNPYLRIALPAVLFSLSHMMTLFVGGITLELVRTFFLRSFMGLVIFGLMMDYTKRLTGNIWTAVFLHAVYDFMFDYF